MQMHARASLSQLDAAATSGLLKECMQDDSTEDVEIPLPKCVQVYGMYVRRARVGVTDN